MNEYTIPERKLFSREVGPKDYNQTFKQWMDDHNDLREMIAEGRSKLEWERKIPDDKLVDLKDMLDSKDFKTNLPKVIKQYTNLLCIIYTPLFSEKKSGLCLMMKTFILISRILCKGHQEDLRTRLGTVQ